MSQILLIESNQELSKVVRLNLMKFYELEVAEKNSVEEGIDLLEILPSINLIIYRDLFENEGQLSQLSNYLSSHRPDIHLIIVGNKKTNYPKELLIEPTSSWKMLVDIVGKVLNLEVKNDLKIDSSYVPVPVSYFLNITETSLGCDVFIRVKKSPTEFQYIKRLNSTDNFNRSDIERYMGQGLRDFYILKEHFPKFVNYVTDKLTAKLVDQNIKGEERTQLSAEVYEVTIDRIHSLGIDERTVELVTENLKTMDKNVGDKNALADYLKLLKGNKLSFAYSHSYLSCLLMNKILKNFEWESASVREKVNYICYFHDISLKGENLVKISTKEELENSGLSSADRNLVMNHANKSAEILDQFPQVPLGVAGLIREHHGVKTGVGFRDSLTITISPISMMFVVIEDFVGQFLSIPGNPTKEQVEEIFKKLSATYNKVTYAQTVAALQSTILSNK